MSARKNDFFDRLQLTLISSSTTAGALEPIYTALTKTVPGPATSRHATLTGMSVSWAPGAAEAALTVTCAEVATNESDGGEARRPTERNADALLPRRTTRERGEKEADMLVLLVPMPILLGNIGEKGCRRGRGVHVTGAGVPEQTATAGASGIGYTHA
jgi:hypothetical protein